MKNNFSIKFKVFDIFILVFALLSIVGSMIVTNVIYAQDLNRKTTIQINYQGRFLKEKEINFDNVEGELQIILKKEDYPDLLGDVIILVNKDKGICIHEVTCPNHYCEKQGWIKNVGYPIVCIPNGIYVVIDSSSIDQDTILG